MRKRAFTSFFLGFLCSDNLIILVEMGLVFCPQYKIEKNALDGCPGIEKEGRFLRRKAMGRYRLRSMDLRSGNRIQAPWLVCALWTFQT